MGDISDELNDPYIESAEEFSSKVEPPPAENQLRSWNWILWILIVFIGMWFYAVLLSINTKTKSIESQMIYMDAIPPNILNSPKSLMNTSIVPSNISVYNQSATYETGDVVVVKFFNIKGVIIERLSGKRYSVLYKNNDHSLNTVTLPAEFIMKPSATMLDPYSLND